MTQTSSTLAFDYDPFSIEAMRDPQSFYPTLRDEHPAWFMPQYDGYAISRFDDVWNAFMDAENFSESEGQLFSRDQMLVHHRGDPPPPILDPMAMFNFIDPPVHNQFRRLLAPPFAKSSINRLAERDADDQRGRDRGDIAAEIGVQIEAAAGDQRLQPVADEVGDPLG
ncbi:MAG: hypothetical protein EOP61_30465, partial [Sphingomonadales bacterium]